MTEESYLEADSTVTLLLLGDAGCGKSVFLSWVRISSPLCHDGIYICQSAIYALETVMTMQDYWPFPRRLKSGKKLEPSQPSTTDSASETLRDSDQPFTYDIRFSKKAFTLELYDTACPNQHWSTLRPDVVIIAFDISNRETLTGLKEVCLF